MAEILQLHLASHHFLTTGMKAMMAQENPSLLVES